MQIKKKENAGLSPKQKLVLQILVAAVFILVLFLQSDGLPVLWDPVYGYCASAALAAVHHLCRIRYRWRG